MHVNPISMRNCLTKKTEDFNKFSSRILTSVNEIYDPKTSAISYYFSIPLYRAVSESFVDLTLGFLRFQYSPGPMEN
jgi:hypothetical protein